MSPRASLRGFWSSLLNPIWSLLRQPSAYLNFPERSPICSDISSMELRYEFIPWLTSNQECWLWCSAKADYFSPPLELNGQIVKGNGFCIDDFTDKAITFIENSTRNKKPFFAYEIPSPVGPRNFDHSALSMGGKKNRIKIKILFIEFRYSFIEFKIINPFFIR